MVGVDEEVGVYHAGGVSWITVWGWSCGGVGPNIGAKEVLSVDCCRNIGEYSLDIPLNGVLPLLVWCGAFVSALMLFVKLVGLVGPECGGVVVALKDAWFEPSCSEEAKYPLKVVEDRKSPRCKF
jgi:hypothetical protein